MPESEAASVLERRYERTLKKVGVLEAMIEDKTRSLYLAQQEVERKNQFLSRVLDHVHGIVIITDLEGTIESLAGSALAALGMEEPSLVGKPLRETIAAEWLAELEGSPELETAFESELVRNDGDDVPVIAVVSPMLDDDDNPVGYVCLTTDISKRRQLELELQQAHKLEAVGQLAAGVAHEINTPIQFIGDSVLFLGEAIDDLLQLTAANKELREAAAAHPDIGDHIAKVEKVESDIDLDFVIEEAAPAVQRTSEGVERVRAIVGAMKQFSHPGADHPAPEDLNDIIDTTLVVSLNEYKYIADIETDLGELPAVSCRRGDISQVVLNIVVNASHAIAAKVEGTSERGRIVITSAADDTGVTITITDNGGGVPPEIRDRIYDPFFTTKEVGKGTGQGLAISRNLVVDGHQGRLTLDVEDGVGSTFSIWLPLGKEEEPDGR